MTKLRPPLTPEYALQAALNVVPIGKIAGACGNSTGMITKYSDIDEPQKFSVEKALIVDRLCLEADGSAPFYELFCHQAQALAVNPAEIPSNVIEAQAALGMVCQRILAGLDRAGDMGQRLSPVERQGVLTAIEQLQGDLHRLTRAVVQAAGS